MTPTIPISQFGKELPVAHDILYDLTQPPPLFFDNEKRAEFSRITAFPTQPSHTLYAANVRRQHVNLNNNVEPNADAAIAGALVFVGIIGLGILIGGTGGLAVVALGLAACGSLEKIGNPVRNTERVSVGPGGMEGNGDSSFPSISADGRFVAFSSEAFNLVSEDTNNRWDVFVHDRQTGKTERVSVDSTDIQGNEDSSLPFISADGHFVTFDSLANNLVLEDKNNKHDIFVYDRQKKQTERVSVGPNDVEGDGNSVGPSISANGRFVAFDSDATNLVPGDTNNVPDVFVRDRWMGRTGGISGDGLSENIFISADGSSMVFNSHATNLVSEDTNNREDLFVVIVNQLKVEVEVERIDNFGLPASLSADGRFVVFWSHASSDPNFIDVFVYDRSAGKTEQLNHGGILDPDWPSVYPPSISADGRFVTFSSPFDPSRIFPSEVFVYDRRTGKTVKISNSDDKEENSNSKNPSISADGRFVTFSSESSNLVPNDTNEKADIFVVGLEHFFEY